MLILRSLSTSFNLLNNFEIHEYHLNEGCVCFEVFICKVFITGRYL